MHLDIAVSPDQCRLLNPNTLDTITGYIMEDTKGEGAKKRLPARRLNMIDGCISSWSSVLNSSERIGLIRQSNELAKVLGELEQDREEDKEEKHQKAEQEEKDKQEQARLRLEKEIKNREEGLLLLPPLLQRLREKGSSELPNFTVPQLRTIIRYEFTDEEGKTTKLNKAGLVEIAINHFDKWIQKQTLIEVGILGDITIPTLT